MEPSDWLDCAGVDALARVYHDNKKYHDSFIPTFKLLLGDYMKKYHKSVKDLSLKQACEIISAGYGGDKSHGIRWAEKHHEDRVVMTMESMRKKENADRSKDTETEQDGTEHTHSNLRDYPCLRACLTHACWSIRCASQAPAEACELAESEVEAPPTTPSSRALADARRRPPPPPPPSGLPRQRGSWVRGPPKASRWCSEVPGRQGRCPRWLGSHARPGLGWRRLGAAGRARRIDLVVAGCARGPSHLRSVARPFSGSRARPCMNHGGNLA